MGMRVRWLEPNIIHLFATREGVGVVLLFIISDWQQERHPH